MSSNYFIFYTFNSYILFYFALAKVDFISKISYSF
jgi:hypothetical protein